MAVTKETLRAILESFGGLQMSDAELEAVLPQVQSYVERAKRFSELDLANTISTRLLRVQEGESHVK